MPMLLRCVLLLLLAAASGGAAAQSCTITAGNLSSASGYDPFAAGFNDSSGIFSITCTRPRGGANRFPAQFFVGASGGSNFGGGTRRLRLGATANYLSYALYRNYPACSLAFGSASLAEVYTFNNSNTGPTSTTTNPNPLTSGTTYCFRIMGGVTTAVPGTYTDIVQIAIGTSITDIWGTRAVTLSTTVSPACRFTTGVPTINLAYTSYQAAPVSGNGTFQLKCTNTTTYSLGFDANTGTVLGLTYNLSVNAPNATGTGAVQGFQVTATVPGGQPGTCAGGTCTGSATRSVVVTY